MRSSFKESQSGSLSGKKLSIEHPLSFFKKPSSSVKRVEHVHGRRSTPVKHEDAGPTTAGNDVLRAELRDSAKRITKTLDFDGKVSSKGYRAVHETPYQCEVKYRPSSTSSYKSNKKLSKEPTPAPEPSKPLQWIKDDPRFRTCDSMSEAKKSEKVIKRPTSSSKVEKISFSQKSIIQSIETMTRKSAHYYFEKQIKQPTSESKDCPYTRLSSSYKFTSSNHNLGDSNPNGRTSMSRLFKHPSIDKKVNPEKQTTGIAWKREKQAVQTTGELKDMITQGMSRFGLPQIKSITF